MSAKQCDTITKIDPEAWSRIYDDRGGPGQNFIFRRSIEIAFELCEPLAHSGARWLDIGCGTGQLMHLLSRKGVHVIGADRDEGMLDYTRRSFSDLAAPVVAASADTLPFGDASLDGVVATSLAGCLPLASSFLVETHRVLRRNGHALITFTNRDSCLLKLNYLARGSAGGGPRYRLYNAREMVRDLKSAGFEIEQVKFYNFVLHAGGWLFPPAAAARRADALFSRPFGKWLGRNFAVLARRSQ